MSGTQPKSAYVLTAIIAILMIVAAIGGLFIDNLYRDNGEIEYGKNKRSQKAC